MNELRHVAPRRRRSDAPGGQRAHDLFGVVEAKVDDADGAGDGIDVALEALPIALRRVLRLHVVGVVASELAGGPSAPDRLEGDRLALRELRSRLASGEGFRRGADVGERLPLAGLGGERQEAQGRVDGDAGGAELRGDVGDDGAALLRGLGPLARRESDPAARARVEPDPHIPAAALFVDRSGSCSGHRHRLARGRGAALGPDGFRGGGDAL